VTKLLLIVALASALAGAFGAGKSDPPLLIDNTTATLDAHN
jgi:hypothetical protein